MTVDSITYCSNIYQQIVDCHRFSKRYSMTTIIAHGAYQTVYIVRQRYFLISRKTNYLYFCNIQNQKVRIEKGIQANNNRNTTNSIHIYILHTYQLPPSHLASNIRDSVSELVYANVTHRDDI